MTPAQLAKSNSEHGHQRALFAWLNMAERYGFDVAWDEKAYASIAYAGEMVHGIMSGEGYDPSVPELKWCHAIPNGGLREARTAAMLKAEGVKRGIPDVFLPVPMWATVAPGGLMNPPQRCITYAGLYVEMKRPKSEEQGRAGTTSGEQDEAIAWLRHSGYAVSVCFTWDAAAREIQSYIEAVRRGGG